eukprot:4506401-Alexandrium_andersonii.AAC.1
MCRLGACVPRQGAARGPGGLARKPARWASSAPELLRRSGVKRSREGRTSDDTTVAPARAP